MVLMRHGFTLIESLVVAGITIIMAGVLLAYNRSSERQLALTVSQAKLVGVLSRAKAFSLEKYAGPNAALDACAFGVHFDGTSVPSKAVVFQDRPGPSGRCLEDDGTPTFTRRYETGEEVEAILFDRGVVVDTGSSPADVLFEPPYLSVYIDGVSTTIPSVVTLALPDGSGSVSVTVGPGGDITAN